MNITLIGMAGVGKSALGKELAKRLGYRFIDTDELIERDQDLTLQEIIDRFGEAKFLKIEQEAILNLKGIDKAIISPGGSVIYCPEAMKFLKENSTIVFLNASFESIEKRIPNRSSRGIVGLREKTLEDVFHERLPLYMKYADITIEMPREFDMEAAFREIVKKVSARG